MSFDALRQADFCTHILTLQCRLIFPLSLSYNKHFAFIAINRLRSRPGKYCISVQVQLFTLNATNLFYLFKMSFIARIMTNPCKYITSWFHRCKLNVELWENSPVAFKMCKLSNVTTLTRNYIWQNHHEWQITDREIFTLIMSCYTKYKIFDHPE